MPKAFLLTNKRYDLYKLNIPKIWRESRKKSDDDEEDRIDSRNCMNDPCQRKSWKEASSDPEWTLLIEEEPVNLSLKKLDLFNLTQLAEVSLSRRKLDQTQQCSVGSPSSNSSSNEKECDDDTNLDAVQTFNPISKSAIEMKSENNSSNSTTSAIRHACVECGRGFSTLSNLARHRQTHRSPTDASVVKKCPNCEKVYVSMPAFSMHLRTHNQGCKCPYCGKGFSRPWLLQGHIRTHTGEKPFKCNICNKAFADKSNLRAHIQTHSSEKPFTCARCQKTFALKSYLCKHIESSCMRSNRLSSNNAPNASNTSNNSTKVV